MSIARGRTILNWWLRWVKQRCQWSWAVRGQDVSPFISNRRATLLTMVEPPPPLMVVIKIMIVRVLMIMVVVVVKCWFRGSLGCTH